MVRLGFRGHAEVARFALQEMAATAVADKRAIAHLHLAAHRDDGGAAIDLHAFEAVVVVVDVLRFGGDDAAVVGIVDHEIGIAAHGDGAFAREETEELRGARAGGVDEAMEVESARASRRRCRAD